MANKLTLGRDIKYTIDGGVVLNGRITAPDPLTGEDEQSGVYEYTIPQPAGDWGEKELLAAMIKQYPTVDITWAEKL